VGHATGEASNCYRGAPGLVDRPLSAKTSRSNQPSSLGIGFLLKVARAARYTRSPPVPRGDIYRLAIAIDPGANISGCQLRLSIAFTPAWNFPLLN